MPESWRPIAHQIDMKAKAILTDCLPAEWAAVEQQPDYAVDYRIEVFERELKTGNFFGVQLKGSETLDPTAENWKYPLKAKHLESFIDIERQPIFLVLVDTKSRQVRLQFLQKYVHENLEGKDWRKQKTVTVALGKQNITSNKDQWKELVSQSIEYVREKLPGGLQATIEHEQQKYEALDPRFSVKLSATDKTKHYSLHPKEDVKLKFNIKLGTDQERLSDWLEKGLPIELNPGEFTIEGSELFKQLAGSARIEPRSVFVGTLTLLDVTEDTEGTIVLSMPAHARLGRSQGQLTAKLPNAPLSIEADLHYQKESPLDFRVSLPFKHWHGQRLLQLAHFQEIHHLFRKASKNSNFSLRFECPGHFTIGFVSPSAQFLQLQEFLEVTETLRMARYMAKHYSINPILLKEHFDNDWDDVVELYHYLVEPDKNRPAPNIGFSAVLPRSQAKSFVNDLATRIQGDHFKIESTWGFWFFDRCLLVRIAREIWPMLFCAASADEQFLNEDLDDITLEFVGNEQTQQKMYVIEPSPPQQSY